MSTIASNIHDIQSSESTDTKPSIGQKILNDIDAAVFRLYEMDDLPGSVTRLSMRQLQTTAQTGAMIEAFRHFRLYENAALIQFETLSRSAVVHALTYFAEDMGYLSSATATPRLDIYYADLRRAIIENFRSVPEVQSIYQDIVDDDLTFWIFTNELQYDDELMDRLIAQEQIILDLYRKTPIMFEYIPSVICQNPEDVISNAARKIYQV